jgi:hypothetical protein
MIAPLLMATSLIACSGSVEAEQTQVRTEIDVLDTLPGDSLAFKIGLMDFVINQCGLEPELSSRLSFSEQDRSQYKRGAEIASKLSASAVNSQCAKFIVVE